MNVGGREPQRAQRASARERAINTVVSTPNATSVARSLHAGWTATALHETGVQNDQTWVGERQLNGQQVVKPCSYTESNFAGWAKGINSGAKSGCIVLRPFQLRCRAAPRRTALARVDHCRWCRPRGRAAVARRQRGGDAPLPDTFPTCSSVVPLIALVLVVRRGRIPFPLSPFPPTSPWAAWPAWS